MTDPKIVVLAGATGHLGGQIARALLDRGARLRCLGDEPALARALAGAFAVVSALQGGPPVIVDAQLGLLRAARAAGVRRFLPSDYSFDFFNLAEGDNINSDWRRAFARAAADVRGDVEVVHVLNGCFLDRGVLFGFLGAIDLAAGEAHLWGDGDAPMDFTTYADTARWTAEAATTDAAPPSRYNVAGDTLDFHGLVAAYAEGSGRALRVVRRGTLADLDAEIDRRRREAPNDPFAWLPLMYWRGMLSGRGKLGPLVATRPPGVAPTTVAAYVRAEAL
jgi:nucleoside-diphosphate-sugar epimerase